jgi:hypothetical protein
VGELFAAIAELYPDKPQLRGAYAERAQYYVFPFASKGDMKTYYHDVGRWISDEGLDINDVYRQLVTKGLGDGRFEFPGVRDLILELQRVGVVKILTFGADKYQRFKAALCPSLDGLEIITTLEPKTDVLGRIGKAGDWLVDDKPVAVPQGMNFVQVNHGDGAEPVAAPQVCTSLEQVAAHIRQTLDV